MQYLLTSNEDRKMPATEASACQAWRLLKHGMASSVLYAAYSVLSLAAAVWRLATSVPVTVYLNFRSERHVAAGVHCPQMRTSHPHVV
jgi:hypothetical protein